MGEHQVDGPSAWSELPEHLEERALAWLPVECLFRFRSVCKRWNSLFRCPNFIHQWTEVSQREPWLVLCMPKTQMRCLAYCFVRHAWRTLSISFIEDKCGVNYRGSAAGLLLVDIPAHSFFRMNAFPSMWVCNPLTRTCFKLPGMLSITIIMARGIVAGANREIYKIVVVGETRGNTIVVEVYDSLEKTWKIAGTLPNGLIIRNEEMVFCGGFFFCMTVQPSRVVAYRIEDGSWMNLPLPLSDTNSVWPRLVACGSSLLIAGAIEEGHVLRDIVVWEFQKKNTSDRCWKEIGRMPQSLCEDFSRSSYSNWFECVGVGEYVCFRAHESMEIVKYNIRQGSWSRLPKCPVTHVDRKYLLLRSMALEPRPDMKVS